MNISIIGASQGVGLAAVKIALEKGHHVTTLSRSPVEVIDQQLLSKIEGNATDERDVRTAIEGSDAILVCLGTKPGTKSQTVCTDFTKVLLSISESQAIKVPVIIVSAFGSGKSWNYSSLLLKILVKLFLRKAYLDKNAMEDAISNSGLNWTVVRPGRLLDTPLSREYIISDELHKGMKVGGISRADVADFMISEAENPKNNRKFTTIISK